MFSPLTVFAESPFCHVRRGFTLIELLAVIAIICFLGILLVPMAGKLHKATQAVQCGNNLGQLARAVLLASSENENTFPPGYIWDREIASYLSVTLASEPSNTPPASIFICPADPRRRATRPRSYVASGLNTSNAALAGCGVFSRNASAPSLRLSQVGTPARTILLTEYFTGGWSASTQFASAYSTVDGWMGLASAPKLENGSNYHGRAGQNYAFADGHVECLTPDKVVDSGAFGTGGLWRAYQP